MIRIGRDSDGEPVHLRDIWPTSAEIADAVGEAVRADMFTKSYSDVFTGDKRWKEIEVPEGDRYTWPDSTYVRRPSFFEGMDAEPSEPSSRSRAPACSLSSATRSPPTTSRPPERSRRTPPRGSG